MPYRSRSMVRFSTFLFTALSIAASASARSTTAGLVQNLVPNPRAMGMGNAFTAVAQDGWALWWNPGAVSLMEEANAGIYSSAKPFGDDIDLKMWTTSVAAGRKGIGFGAYYSRFDLAEYEITGPGGEDLGNFRPRDDAIHVAGSVDLIRVYRGRPGPVSLGLGLSAKRIHTLFLPARANPGHGDISGTAYDADLGVMLQGRTALHWQGREIGSCDLSGGFFQRNLFDSGMDFNDQDGSDPIGSFGRFGFAAHASFGHPRLFASILDITAAVDQTGPLRRFGGRVINNRGIEVGLLHLVHIRRGKIEDKEGGVVGTTEGWGVGPELKIAGTERTVRLRLDYAKVPQADPMPKLEQYSVSFGIEL